MYRAEEATKVSTRDPVDLTTGTSQARKRKAVLMAKKKLISVLTVAGVMCIAASSSAFAHEF